jgi:hypothetical protein
VPDRLASMTISIAWTRKEHDVEQLVFASDSRISAGEKFDACPKMLALPRGDCGIAYAGTSGDALSMMLQLSLAIQSYPAAMKRSLELSALRTHALKIFNAMLKEIKLEQIKGNPSIQRTDASFLFGGYSWRRKDFEFWSFRYSKANNEFVTRRPMNLAVDLETNTISTNSRSSGKHRPIGRIAFVGDQSRAAERIVIKRLNEKLRSDPKLSRLHMEPLEAIRDLLRNRDLRNPPDKDSIGGPPQMMKVFQYSQTASFAFMWPDSDGAIRPFLNGRPCLDYENLDIVCLDPDTFDAVYMGGGKRTALESGEQSAPENSLGGATEGKDAGINGRRKAHAEAQG